MVPANIPADMAILEHLNAFISERLTAAAVEIFGAVERTLMEYQGEISRSKQEICHLRSLLLWPRVRLQTSVHQLSPHRCDEEDSPDYCHEEDWAPDVRLDHPNTLHVKDEHNQRADQQGTSCRQQGGTTVSPHFEGHEEPPSHLCRILTVEPTADVKAEHHGDESVTSPSAREVETFCEINAESTGLQQEYLKDQLETARHERGGLDQPYTEQDHKDPDPPQVKAELLTLSQEVAYHDHKLPLQSGSGNYDEPHSSSPSHDQTLSNRTFHTAEDKRRDAEGEGCELSRVSQPFYSVNQNECDTENTEHVLNGERIEALAPTGTRQKKRHNSSLFAEKGDGIGVEGDVNDLTRERRHTCPICGKRFKESGHLKDHVRIHTGEKPYGCKECGMNFRQSGALTLHMRIHTGERPYQCSDCGRRFNRKGDMENHRVTHTGERPHVCIVCGKSFKRRGNLNTHLKIHAEDKMDYTQPL